MGMLRVNIGIHPLGFQWLLPPSHVFSTPEVVLVRSDRGLGGLSRELHTLYNHQLIPIHTINTTAISPTHPTSLITMKSLLTHPLKHHNRYTLESYRPAILLNTWESKYFTISHGDVLEMAKLAAPIGVWDAYMYMYMANIWLLQASI